MVTSSDDYLTCLSQIWSRYEAFHSKMSRLSKVTLLNESTFVIKVSRWFKWSCLFFRDAEWGIWSLSASQKCSYSVLENELFISVFSSELRVCVIIRAGCRSSMRLEYRLKCVSIASRIEKNSSTGGCHQEVWTRVTTWSQTQTQVMNLMTLLRLKKKKPLASWLWLVTPAVDLMFSSSLKA